MSRTRCAPTPSVRPAATTRPIEVGGENEPASTARQAGNPPPLFGPTDPHPQAQLPCPTLCPGLAGGDSQDRKHHRQGVRVWPTRARRQRVPAQEHRHVVRLDQHGAQQRPRREPRADGEEELGVFGACGSARRPARRRLAVTRYEPVRHLVHYVYRRSPSRSSPPLISSTNSRRLPGGCDRTSRLR